MSGQELDKNAVSAPGMYSSSGVFELRFAQVATDTNMDW